MIQEFVVFGLLVVAGAIDIKTRRVPHWLWLAGFITGTVLMLGSFSWLAFLNWFGGSALMLFVGWVLYRLNAWGGGDAYLLLAIGSLLGFAGSIKYLFAMSIVGIIYVVLCKIYAALKRSQDNKFPFVPAMALASVLDWYI